MRGATALLGALLGAACTNDYDAILEQASGGGSAASSTAETTGSTTDAASSTSASASASSSASSSTSTSSAEGGGGSGPATGTGGSGGDGTGGAGGAGGQEELRGSQHCALRLGLQGDVDLGQLPDDWNYDDLGDVVGTATNGELTLVFDGDDGFAELEHDVDLGDPAFQECSLETSVQDLPDVRALEDVTVAAFLSVKDGDDYLLSIAAARIAGDGGDETVWYMADGDGSPIEDLDALGDPPVGFRLRFHAAHVYFDVRGGSQGWKQVYDLDPDADSLNIDRIAYGGLRTSSSDEEELDVVVGAMNAP